MMFSIVLRLLYQAKTITYRIFSWSESQLSIGGAAEYTYTTEVWSIHFTASGVYFVLTTTNVCFCFFTGQKFISESAARKQWSERTGDWKEIFIHDIK